MDARDLDVELGLEGRGEVELGEDPEPLAGQRGADRVDRGVEVVLLGEQLDGLQAIGALLVMLGLVINVSGGWLVGRLRTAFGGSPA